MGKYWLLLWLLVGTVLSACTTEQWKRASYDVLRQADCRQREKSPNCIRSFPSEYQEYQVKRKEYLEQDEDNSAQ